MDRQGECVVAVFLCGWRVVSLLLLHMHWPACSCLKMVVRLGSIAQDWRDTAVSCDACMHISWQLNSALRAGGIHVSGMAEEN
jgi:hypothetical protein